MNDATFVPQKLAITLPADAIAWNFGGVGESVCFHCFDACFKSGVK